MPKTGNSKRYTVLFIAIFAALLLLAMDFGGFTGPLRNVTSPFTNPIRFWTTKQVRVVTTFVNDLTQIASLRSTNKELEEKILSLESQISDENSLQIENESLRDQLEIPGDLKLEMLMGRIIGGDTTSVGRGSMTIDIGSSQGVVAGMTAQYSGHMIGVVREVNEYNSHIDLVGGSSIEIGGISEETRTKGLVTGDVNSGLTMSRILREEEINVGEKILSSGVGTSPYGLIIGEVYDIAGEDTDSEKTALVKQIIEISKLEWVYLINVNAN